MDCLNFSTNWNNKLTGKTYTTIRLFNEHRFKIGKTFMVTIKKKNLHVAQVVDLKVITPDTLNEWIARLDTGYSLPETLSILKKMYGTQYSDSLRLHLVLLEVVKNSYQNYLNLLD